MTAICAKVFGAKLSHEQAQNMHRQLHEKKFYRIDSWM